MDTISIVPASQNEAVFKCSRCGQSKTIDISKYRLLPKAVKGRMKCNCGQFQKFIVDRRIEFRKNMKLLGEFIYQSKSALRNDEQVAIAVEDISMTGLKFKIRKTSDVKIGDTVLVTFYLDDPLQTLIQKEVIIRNIVGSSFGVEFKNKSKDDLSNKKIRDYLSSLKNLGIAAMSL